jgi:hypothetical protein
MSFGLQVVIGIEGVNHPQLIARPAGGDVVALLDQFESAFTGRAEHPFAGGCRPSTER